jgi:hypothetical protein
MSFKGITESLRVLNEPIAALTALKQEEIMARAQQPANSPTHIPPSYVSTILNAKAQMIQDAANRAAAQKVMPPSVTERNMATIALAEVPQMQQRTEPDMDAGVASLPVPEEMYSDDYAGGGIVAFDEGGLAGTFDPFVSQEPTGTGKPLVGLDVPEELVGKIGLPQVYGIREGRYGRTKEEILKSFGFKQPTAKSAVTTSEEIAPAPAPTISSARASVADSVDAPKVSAPTPKESIDDRRRRMLEQLGVTDTTEEELAALEKNKGKLADDKFDAMRMAIIRAGLGMAAGTSPYALSNIAKGGLEGFESYEQSIKQIKAEEKEYSKLARDLRKEANALKRSDVDKALALEYQAAQLEIEREKLIATRQAANKTPAEIQLIERYAKDRGINFSQAMREISGLKAEPKSRDEAMKKWASSPILQRNYPNFEDFYSSTRVDGGGGGFKVLGKETG